MTKPKKPKLPKASVIIPTRNAGSLFNEVMRRVSSQDHPDYEIVIVDTSSRDDTVKIAKKYGARVYSITQNEFTHGGTRNYAVSKAKGSVVAFLSQDATPATRNWLSSMVSPLQDRKVAGVFGGQTPRPDAPPMEKFFYAVRFPHVRRRRGLKKQGSISLDDIFFSNVNSAMRRSTLRKYPFDSKIIMSEDQEWAKRVLTDGYETLYEPKAAVIHSHNYTLKTAFKRYFDSAYSLMEITDDTFRNFTAKGISYTFDELRYVADTSPKTVPYLFFYDLSKVAGTFFGRHARKIPNMLRKRMSLHSYHWSRK